MAVGWWKAPVLYDKKSETEDLTQKSLDILQESHYHGLGSGPHYFSPEFLQKLLIGISLISLSSIYSKFCYYTLLSKANLIMLFILIILNGSPLPTEQSLISWEFPIWSLCYNFQNIYLVTSSVISQEE